MTEHAWVEGFSGAVTVCDERGILLAMNEKAAQAFSEDGGRALIGTSVLDCHPEPAGYKLEDLMEKQTANVYTIQKQGKKNSFTNHPGITRENMPGLSNSRSRFRSTCPISSGIDLKLSSLFTRKE